MKENRNLLTWWSRNNNLYQLSSLKFHRLLVIIIKIVLINLDRMMALYNQLSKNKINFIYLRTQYSQDLNQEEKYSSKLNKLPRKQLSYQSRIIYNQINSSKVFLHLWNTNINQNNMKSFNPEILKQNKINKLSQAQQEKKIIRIIRINSCNLVTINQNL
jgi:hypothetical protein